MARSDTAKTIKEDREGPFLGIAVFCEMVLNEKDNVQSVIRIIDRYTIKAAPNSPAIMPPTPIPLRALIMLKAGAAKGKHTVTLQPRTPSGGLLPKAGLPVLFEGEDRGVSLDLRMGFEASEEGLYWFDVFLNEKRMTSIPFRILYERATLG